MSTGKVDVLAVMDNEASALDAEGYKVAPAKLREARDAVCKLIAAAELVANWQDMSTVRGRMEMQRRIRALNAALAGAQ